MKQDYIPAMWILIPINRRLVTAIDVQIDTPLKKNSPVPKNTVTD